MNPIDPLHPYNVTKVKLLLTKTKIEEEATQKVVEKELDKASKEIKNNMDGRVITKRRRVL